MNYGVRMLTIMKHVNVQFLTLFAINADTNSKQTATVLKPAPTEHSRDFPQLP